MKVLWPADGGKRTFLESLKLLSCTDVAECGMRMIDFAGQDGLVGINKVGKTQSGVSELIHFVRIKSYRLTLLIDPVLVL